MKRTILPLFAIAALSAPLTAEHRVEKNVVYGMYSGLALLMDIHYPETPNGYGVVHVSGSGWTRGMSLDAPALKESGHVRIEGAPVVAAGYTLFTINHRALPRFQYKEIIGDVQRAVRFVRYHAKDYGIDPNKIGAWGGSSGGHLVSMMGALDGEGDPDNESEINRVSSKVQAVVARAPAIDPGGLGGSATVGLLLGARIREGLDPMSDEMRIARDASVLTYVTPDDPPYLLLHGDKDDTVPLSQSERLRDAFLKRYDTKRAVASD